MNSCYNFENKKEKGSIIILVLVFGAIFSILLSGLVGFITLQHRQSLQKVAWENSLHIAEAGVNYFKWKINKVDEITEQDVQDGETWCCGSDPYSSGNCEWCGPYTHDFKNTDGNIVGQFEISIKPKQICGKFLALSIKSNGYTLKFPDINRNIQVKLASTSIADYAYILNENTWAEAGRDIFGKYKCNQGIRMDATHNSLVESSKGDSTEEEGWICASSFGCDYLNCPEGCVAYDLDGDSSNDSCLCQGIIGSGGPQDLWKLRSPKFNFEEIQASLTSMKDLAIASGKYYEPSKNLHQHGQGYWLIFKEDGTYDIRIVTKLKSVDAATMRREGNEDKVYCYESKERIQNSHIHEENVSISPECGLIFIEDNLWVEGVVKDRKTVAAAKFGSAEEARVILYNNLDYETLPPDGSDSLSIITQGDILIPLRSPEDMTLRGIFVTQHGHFGRDLYSADKWWWCDNLCPDPPDNCWIKRKKYPAYAQRNNLTIYGSIVSNGRVVTKWDYWDGWTGYNQGYNYFDEKLSKNPPPLLPNLSTGLNFISWEEI
jgi:hypothetical protein